MSIVCARFPDKLNTCVCVWPLPPTPKCCLRVRNGADTSKRLDDIPFIFLPSRAAKAVCFLDGYRLASGSDDTTLRCWELSTEACTGVLKEHEVKGTETNCCA